MLPVLNSVVVELQHECSVGSKSCWNAPGKPRAHHAAEMIAKLQGRVRWVKENRKTEREQPVVPSLGGGAKGSRGKRNKTGLMSLKGHGLH